MNFCSDCGNRLVTQVQPGKQYPQILCQHCHTTFHHHPKLLVASFIHCGDKLLWMQRGLQPKKGHWAIPAGFMEEGETLQQAAARELFEETGVVISPEKLQLYMMGTISFISEVYVGFHAQVDSEYCVAGSESLDVGFFRRDELPWEEVAYPEANNSIIQAYDDLACNQFGVYHAEMTADKNNLLPVNTRS